jgi:uncharacterized protein with GYD domain
MAKSLKRHAAVRGSFAVNYNRALHVPDVSAAIGISERTLRNCCVDSRAGGPRTSSQEADRERGCKAYQLLLTKGDSDFLIVTEGDDAESVIAALLATAGAGTISDIHGESLDWLGVQSSRLKKASKAGKAYKAPG